MNWDHWNNTRHSLIDRLRNLDDQASWQEFHAIYWRPIHALAMRAGLDESEAEEVVQETVIAICRQMPDFDYDPAVGTFKAYVLAQTQWKISDFLRRRDRHRRGRHHTGTGRDTRTVERVADPARHGFEEMWDAEWAKNLFERALDRVRRQVNPKHYQIFDCYVLRKWPLRKITSTLGVNVAQVYLAKSRVNARLRKEIKRLEAELL